MDSLYPFYDYLLFVASSSPLLSGKYVHAYLEHFSDLHFSGIW